MKMRQALLAVFLLTTCMSQAQNAEIDSLRNRLEEATNPIAEVDLLNKLSFAYHRISLSEAESIAHETLILAGQHGYQEGLAGGYSTLGICACIKGDYDEGLNLFMKCLSIREELRDTAGVAKTLNNIAGVYRYQNNHEKSVEFAVRALDLISAGHDRLA